MRFRKTRCRGFLLYPPQLQSHPENPQTCFEGPFGEVIRATGPMAKANPFRFSTKYQDDETDFLYYGYRYYTPSMGRWLNHDPVEELGFDWLQSIDTSSNASSPNVYNFIANNPISAIDLLGLKLGDMPGEHPYPPYNPPAAGQKCCCSPPSRITGTRTDGHPRLNWTLGIYSKWTIFMSVALDVHDNPDCFRDIEVQWQRCWGVGGAGYMGSGTSISTEVGTWTGYRNGWLINARIFYLTCEKGLWTKRRTNASLAQLWTGWGWEFGGPSIPIFPVAF